MKHQTFLILIASSILVLGCSVKKDGNKKPTDPCVPRTMLVVYVGEQTKPILPLLIRTNEMDTTYYQYIGDSEELFQRNNFIISEDEYMKKIIVSDDVFAVIKTYVMQNNTERHTVTYQDGYNSLNIILIDRCDSLNYIVDGRDKLFFKNLVDSVRQFSDNNLILRLEYLKDIQERVFD